VPLAQARRAIVLAGLCASTAHESAGDAIPLGRTESGESWD
jgi:hypothetical protein